MWIRRGGEGIGGMCGLRDGGGWEGKGGKGKGKEREVNEIGEEIG